MSWMMSRWMDRWTEGWAEGRRDGHLRDHKPLWRPVSGHQVVILKISFLESHMVLEWLAGMSRLRNQDVVWCQRPNAGCFLFVELMEASQR